MPGPHTNRFISLGTKLVVLTVVVLSIISSAVYLELTVRERESLFRSKQIAAGMVADLFAISLTAPLDFNDKDEIEATLSHLRPNADVLYAAVWLPSADAAVATLDRSTAAEQRRYTYPTGHSEVTNGQVVETRNIVTPTGKPLGAVTLHFSLAAENAAFAASRLRILGLSVGMTLLAAALLTGIARRIIVSPIERLVAAAQRLEAGERPRVTASANDEVGRLARAFNQMASAIADRESNLASARQSLQELVDHLRQGIVVFGAGGAVEELVSRQAALIFGGDEAGASRFTGRDIRGLLYPEAPAFDAEAFAFNEWVGAVFDLPAASWDELSALAPKEVVIDRADGVRLELALEFRPIAQEDRIARVMLLVTDETERRRLQRVVDSHERQHARQIAAMRRLMSGGAAMFATFVDTTNDRLQRCQELAAELLRTQKIGDVDELFHHLHTLKGEARSFDLGELEVEISSAEDTIDELRQDTRRGSDASLARCATAIVARLHTMTAMVARARELFIEASPIGGSVLDQVTVSRALLKQLEGLTQDRQDDVGELVRGLVSRPFGELTANILDGIADWALREHKKVDFEVRGKETPISGPHANVLRGVLTHLLRNAVAHGVEPAEARQAAGKSPTGKVFVECSKDGNQTMIVVSDDGPGLNLAALSARGEELGLPAGMAAADLAVVPALSTAKVLTDLAGRGVGLSAVLADLARIGWDLEITSVPAQGTRVTMRSSKPS